MTTAAAVSRPGSNSASHDSEIFVVDDDDNMRELLAAILSLEGFPVTSFADGETFLKASAARRPVCVFLDVMMPGRSGIDILKELSARSYEPPVFLISGRGDAPMVVDALKSGALDFLHKPFDPYAAVERVRAAVELWSRRNEKQTSAGIEAKQFPGKVRLTRREAEVLAQIVRGISSKEIGAALGIGKRTVDNVRMSVMRKLGAKNTADLVRIIMS